MRIQLLINRLAWLPIMLIIATTCFSQSKTSIGLSLTGEHASSSNFTIGFGGTFEKQFNKHHGLETGLYYRTFDLHTQVFVDGALFASYTEKEEYLSVPVLYKFYSHLVNVSFGPTFNIYTGWKQGKGDMLFRDNHFPVTKFQVGLLGKISKTISITKRFFLEPEVRYNPIFYNQWSYYGAAIAVKYMWLK